LTEAYNLTIYFIDGFHRIYAWSRSGSARKTKVGARLFSERSEKVGESEEKSMTLMAVAARGGAGFSLSHGSEPGYSGRKPTANV
jgi:hypothetical protein